LAKPGVIEGIRLEDEAADRRGIERSDLAALAEDGVRDQEMGMEIRIARAGIARDVAVLDLDAPAGVVGEL
jgi:hypothetical protein